MLRVCTSLCLAAGVTTAAAFADQQPTDRLLDLEGRWLRDVTVTGCVAPGSQPDAYTLAVIAESDAESGALQPAAALAPGTPLRLAGLPPGDFQEYVGQQVEVFGMLRPHGSSHGHGRQTNSDDPSKVIVRSIRQLATTCSAPTPSASPAVAAAAPAVPRRGSRGRGHDRAMREPAPMAPAGAPATSPTSAAGGARPVTSSTPGWAAGSASAPTGGVARPVTSSTPGMPAGTPPASAAGVARPVTSSTPGLPAGTPPASAAGVARPVTSSTPGLPAASPRPSGSVPSTSPTGAAPANATTTNAASGQSGISGSATLGGTIAMTPPVITFPIGRTPSTPTAASGATPSTQTLPEAGLAQGATNTTTSNAALDQFGLTGDAMLSGLVNVNIQQLLASVQVIANVNVQDVVVNVSDILNDNQIQALVQALNTNPQAALNANDLTSALQQAGVLDPSQWVVGVTGSQIYENRNLSTALQERGIIQPGETIMGTSTPHVFVVGDK